MNTWIFTHTPQTFDVNGYLAVSGGTIIWDVNIDVMGDLGVGDSVYIWMRENFRSLDRSGRSRWSPDLNRSPGFIIAEGRVLEKPRSQPDDPKAMRFKKRNSIENLLRVKIGIIHTASLPFDILMKDDTLKNMGAIRYPTTINYLLSEVEAQRLHDVWRSATTS